MYADPRHIRDHEVKVRLNEDEMKVLEALAQYNHVQKSVLARELILAALTKADDDDNHNQLSLTA